MKVLCSDIFVYVSNSFSLLLHSFALLGGSNGEAPFFISFCSFAVFYRMLLDVIFVCLFVFSFPCLLSRELMDVHVCSFFRWSMSRQRLEVFFSQGRLDEADFFCHFSRPLVSLVTVS